MTQDDRDRPPPGTIGGDEDLLFEDTEAETEMLYELMQGFAREMGLEAPGGPRTGAPALNTRATEEARRARTVAILDDPDRGAQLRALQDEALPVPRGADLRPHEIRALERDLGFLYPLLGLGHPQGHRQRSSVGSAELRRQLQGAPVPVWRVPYSPEPGTWVLSDHLGVFALVSNLHDERHPTDSRGPQPPIVHTTEPGRVKRLQLWLLSMTRLELKTAAPAAPPGP